MNDEFFEGNRSDGMISVTLVQSLIEIPKLSPWLKYNGLEVCSTFVEWGKQPDEQQQQQQQQQQQEDIRDGARGSFYCPTDCAGRAPFGVAELNLCYSARINLGSLFNGRSSLCVGLTTRHPFTEGKLETLSSEVLLSDWLKNVKRDQVKKDQARFYVSQIFSLPLLRKDGEKCGQTICNIEIYSNYHRKFCSPHKQPRKHEQEERFKSHLKDLLLTHMQHFKSLRKGQKTPLSRQLLDLLKFNEKEFQDLLLNLDFENKTDEKICDTISDELFKQDKIIQRRSRTIMEFNEYVFESEGAERVAKHIYDIYKPNNMELSTNVRNVLQKIVKPTPDTKNFRVNVYAFYILTEILFLKDPDPIAFSCKVAAWAGQFRDYCLITKRPYRAQRWQEIRSSCEERTYNFLNAVTKLSPSEAGENGPIWLKNLINKAPDYALKANSPKIAGHLACVDSMTYRWNQHYSNWCWGVPCLSEQSRKSARLSPALTSNFGFLFDSPKSSFWWSFFFYVVFLTFCTWSLVNSEVGLSQFHEALLRTIITDTNFADIDSTDLFWDWMSEVLGSGNVVFPDANITDSTVLIGDLTIRQFRVKPTPCPTAPSKLCYQSLLPDESNWETEGIWKNTKWDSSYGHTFIGSFDSLLPTGGFVVNLPANQSFIQENIEILKNDSWIDGQTRHVIIEFVLYNTNGFCSGVCLFVEWNYLGGIDSDFAFYTIPWVNLTRSQWLSYVIVIFVIGFLLHEVFQFTTDKNKIQYLRNPWNLLDFIIFFLYLVQWCFFFGKGFYSTLWENHISPEYLDFTTTYDLWKLYTSEVILGGAFFMIFWFRLIYYLRSFETTGPILKVTAKLVEDVISFAFFLLFVVGAGALMMDTILRGTQIEYKDFSRSYITLIRGGIGHGDFIDDARGGTYARMESANTFYYFFLIGVTVILVNLLIALMNNTYSIWYNQAIGLWVLESTELLQQCEVFCWPVPLNLIGLPLFFLRGIFAPHKYYHQEIYSRKIVPVIPKTQTNQTNQNNLSTTTSLIDSQNEKDNDYEYHELEASTIGEEGEGEGEADQGKDEAKLDEDAPVMIRTGKSMDHGLNYINRFSASPSSSGAVWVIDDLYQTPVTTQKQLKMKYLDIINECDCEVFIYLKLGSVQSFFLKMFPKTKARLPRNFVGYSWVAYSNVSQKKVRLDTGIRVSNIGTLGYPAWFELVVHSFIPHSCCNFCGKIFQEGIEEDTFCIVPKRFIDKYQGSTDYQEHLVNQNVITCLNCYYRAYFENHFKKNEIPTVFQRLQWWKRGQVIEIGKREKYIGPKGFIKKSKRNRLVKMIIQRYLNECAIDKEEKENEFATLPLVNESDKKDE